MEQNASTIVMLSGDDEKVPFTTLFEEVLTSLSIRPLKLLVLLR